MATATKTAPEKNAIVPADDSWGWCPPEQGGCGRERRVVEGVMVQHRRYSNWEREMVFCNGSGQPPAAE